jgi:hypothetical protein
MISKKQNCWEYMKCGREPRGEKVAELGICRTAIKENFNGINFGKNGGRMCFAVAGTYCTGEADCTFAKKLASSKDCSFYETL